jgi:replication factor C large subunit
LFYGLERIDINDFIGNEDARRNILKWLKEWTIGAKPLLLIGPPGIGKTSFIHAISSEFGLDLIDLNASDMRNKNSLDEVIFPLLSNASLSGKTFLLFLDEIDGIFGTVDSGAVSYLLEILKNPGIRIVMAANRNNQSIRELSKISKIVNFQNISPRLMMIYLNKICKIQNKSISDADKISIVINSGGDIRCLLNVFQAKVAGYSMITSKNRNFDIDEAVNRFFMADNKEAARSLILNSDLSFSDPRFGSSSEDRRRDILNAFFSSIVMSNLDNESLSILLDALSKIDVIIGKMYSRRNWKMLRYISLLFVYSIFELTRNKYLHYHRYNIGFQQMGSIFSRSMILKNTLTNLSHMFHTSKSTFGSIYFPYLAYLLSMRSDRLGIIENSAIFEADKKAIIKETYLQGHHRQRE